MSDKRTELKAVAAEAVQRSGLRALSFRTLAEAVGVKSSSVHYYFPEKADLARALIETYTQDFEGLLAAIDRRSLTPANKLEAFVKIFDDAVKADKLCLCGMLAAEVASLDEANRKLLHNYFQLLELWLSGLFKEHAQQLVSDLKPRVLARVVLSGLEGAMLIDRVDGGREHLKAQRALVRGLFKSA